MQFGAGNIPDREAGTDRTRSVFLLPQIDINPGILQRVFRDICEEILRHAPEMMRIRHTGHRFLGSSQDRRKSAFLQHPAEFSQHLVQEFLQIQPDRIHLDITGGDLGGLHQILGQMLELSGFFLQDTDIFRGPFIIDLLALQQIRVIDDGSQRSLDIMRHIGDEIRFHPLILHAPVHGFADPFSDIIDRFRQPPVLSVKFPGIDLSGIFAGVDPFDLFDDRVTVDPCAAEQDADDDIRCEHQQEHREPRIIPETEKNGCHDGIEQDKQCVGQERPYDQPCMGSSVDGHAAESLHRSSDQAVLPQHAGTGFPRDPDSSRGKSKIRKERGNRRKYCRQDRIPGRQFIDPADDEEYRKDDQITRKHKP